MFWLDHHNGLLYQEVILVQAYLYRPSLREKEVVLGAELQTIWTLLTTQNFMWHRHSSKRTNSNQKFSRKTYLEKFIKKINEAFIWIWRQSPRTITKAEKEKVAIKDVKKKALETLAETKKWKQEEEEEVKRTKKPRTTGNETSAYLREKAAKDREERMLHMKTQNEEVRAQRLLLEQYHNQQQQQQQTHQQMYCWQWWPYLRNFLKKD